MSTDSEDIHLRPYQNPLETWSQKFVRKFKENPWVPIGCAATCGALIMSAAKLRAGKSKDMNYWLRARVVLQGLTLVALVTGSMAVQKARNEKSAVGGLESNDGPRRDEKTKEQDKAEFEERLKAAERADEEEAGLLKVVKGPAVNNDRRDAAMKTNVAEQMPATDGPTMAAVKTSSSWWSWKNKGSDSQDNGKV